MIEAAVKYEQSPATSGWWVRVYHSRGAYQWWEPETPVSEATDAGYCGA